MENLGNKIRELRIEKNLTQPALAMAIGVSKGVLSFWENDINEPKASNLKALCQVLDVSADYLLGLED